MCVRVISKFQNKKKCSGHRVLKYYTIFLSRFALFDKVAREFENHVAQPHPI